MTVYHRACQRMARQPRHLEFHLRYCCCWRPCPCRLVRKQNSRPTNSSASDGHKGRPSWIMDIGLWFRQSYNEHTLTQLRIKT
jgi:hypothetical protein